ncbi:Protein ZINC INDUCED FACILITATOR-LIKE 1, partial [Mucuna pruriens]
DCPGCKVDQAKELSQGQGVPVRDFNIAKIEADISCYAVLPFFDVFNNSCKLFISDACMIKNVVGFAFMLGRCLTFVLWGIVADRYGRKPVIIIGIVAVVIFNTLFGLSTSFWMAVIMRFLLGSLNGLLGPMRAYATELFREEHQDIALSTGTALIVGPALGGYLAQPAEKYPHIFPKNSFWDKFPYFLPNFIISVFATIVAIGCIWIPCIFHINIVVKMLAGNPSQPKFGSSGVGNKIIQKNENLFLNWPLMSSIIIYCVFSLHDIAYQEVFSLWAVSPRRLGGLNFTTDDVGNVLSISGASLEPTIDITIITGLFLLQNRAVEQHQRAAANGISITCMSLCIAIGPATGGAVVTWSQKRMHSSFLPGTNMVFFALNLVEGLGILLMFKPFLVEKKKTHSDQLQ